MYTRIFLPVIGGFGGPRTYPVLQDGSCILAISHSNTRHQALNIGLPGILWKTSGNNTVKILIGWRPVWQESRLQTYFCSVALY